MIFLSLEAKPIVKWAGGKSKTINKLLPYFPIKFNNYHEPFLGSGAVFFYLYTNLATNGPKAFLSDLNEELINLYEVVRDEVKELIKILKTHRYDKDYYYSIRGQNPRKLTKIERASRVLYLNKTCFNGLWRVNSNGQFNVSFGNYVNPKIVDEPVLYRASAILKKVELFCSDFEGVLKSAKKGDLVYLDPPYVPVSSSANFTGYTSQSFGEDDHIRLQRVFERLKKRGCFVALSNSNTEMVKALYGKYNIKTITALRAINSNPKKRGAVKELLILSYPDAVCRFNLVDEGWPRAALDKP